MKFLDFKAKEIYIGHEDEFYIGKHIILIDENLTLKIGGAIQWGKNYLNKLKFNNDILKEYFFENLEFTQELYWHKSILNVSPVNSKNFVIEKKHDISFLIVIFGTEKQPGLYQIFIEAVIEFENDEIYF